MEPSLFWIGDGSSGAASAGALPYDESSSAGTSEVGASSASARLVGGGGWKGLQEGGPLKFPALHAPFTALQYFSHWLQFRSPVGPAD